VIRRLLLVFLGAAAVFLVPWTVYLAYTLPTTFDTGQWNLAWVGFDAGLGCCFALACWLGWRRHRAAVPMLAATATLLCCDAWFDVILDTGTRDIWGSLASAVFIELPLAFLMFNAARRLIRVSALAAMSESGPAAWSADDRKKLPIWKIPLAGVDLTARRGNAAGDGETTARSDGKSHSHRW
jgi:hypothetical protein